MTIAQLKELTRQPLCFGIRSVLDLQRARNAVVLNLELEAQAGPADSTLRADRFGSVL